MAIICGLCYSVPQIWRKLRCWSRRKLADHCRLRAEWHAMCIRKEYSAVMASMSQAEAARLLLFMRHHLAYCEVLWHGYCIYIYLVNFLCYPLFPCLELTYRFRGFIIPPSKLIKLGYFVYMTVSQENPSNEG